MENEHGFIHNGSEFPERPKWVRIGASRIPNAGMGLYLLEDAKKGDFVARYSGDVIDKNTNESRKGGYHIKISNNLYLDVEQAGCLTISKADTSMMVCVPVKQLTCGLLWGTTQTCAL